LYIIAYLDVILRTIIVIIHHANIQ